METAFAIKKYKLVNTILHQYFKNRVNILDVGCATGEITEYLTGINYTGVDIDKNNILEMKKRNLEVVEVDLSKQVPQIKKKFNAILMLDILEHLQNPAAVIENVKTLLEKDGVLVISLPNDYNFFNKVRFILNKNINWDPFDPYGHLHIFPIKTGKRFLEGCGLKIVNSYLLEPTKPGFLGKKVLKFIAMLSPNNFCRGVLYICKI